MCHWQENLLEVDGKKSICSSNWPVATEFVRRGEVVFLFFGYFLKEKKNFGFRFKINSNV